MAATATITEIPSLTAPQERMLLAANRRYRKVTPMGNPAHFTTVSGAGRVKTAKALEALGLGGYGEGVFWIYPEGHQVAEAIKAAR